MQVSMNGIVTRFEQAPVGSLLIAQVRGIPCFGIKSFIAGVDGDPADVQFVVLMTITR